MEISQIMYSFALRAENCTISEPNNFPHVTQKYTKFGNFVRLYFPHFTTFHEQTKTLRFYLSYCKMLFICGDVFLA